jgi:hypothetical protein
MKGEVFFWARPHSLDALCEGTKKIRESQAFEEKKNGPIFWIFGSMLYLRNMNKTKFQKGVELILNGSEQIERAEDGSCYIHKETGQKLDRATSFIRNFEPFYLPPIWAGALPVGTAVDQVIRDFFVEGPERLNYDDYKENLSKRAFEQLLADLGPFASRLLSEGWRVYGDRVLLFNLAHNVAGEVDLLLVHEEAQEVKILDIKTSRAGLNDASLKKRYQWAGRRNLNPSQTNSISTEFAPKK